MTVDAAIVAKAITLAHEKNQRMTSRRDEFRALASQADTINRTCNLDYVRDDELKFWASIEALSSEKNKLADVKTMLDFTRSNDWSIWSKW